MVTPHSNRWHQISTCVRHLPPLRPSPSSHPPQVTVADAEGIADAAAQHALLCILAAVQVSVGVLVGGWWRWCREALSCCRAFLL